jgi:rSAM/selenodomain-associated transferase 1
MSRPVVIIFTRIPRLGVGKRRLARQIGDRAALNLSRTLLHKLLRRLRPVRGVTRIIAATPDHHAKFHAPGWTRLPQGRGDLGARMQRAIARFPRRPVVLIGSDIPGVTEADLRTALHVLCGHHAVFGPAADGGYWLIGQSARRPATPFANTRWSSAHALADTTRNFPRRRIKLLRPLADIDDTPPQPGLSRRRYSLL